MNICTLFDSAYAPKGFALLASIRRHMPEARVFVLALDDDVMNDITVPGVKVIPLAWINDRGVLEARNNRTWQEFVWTLASVWAFYAVAHFDLDSIAYMDADTFLFSDLAPLYDEVGEADVAIIPHRWTPKYEKRLRPNGIYNVSWVYFKSSPVGIECLRTWTDQCLKWCYYANDAGRFADQGYLNDWPERWGAHVVEHLGANLAPWNQEQYRYAVDGHGRLTIHNSTRHDPLLFYHFHELELKGGRVSRRTNYPLAREVARYVYPPYEAELGRVYAVTTV